MKILHLLAIGLAAGVMVAACDNGSTDSLSNGTGRLGAGEGDDDDDDSTGTDKNAGSSSGGTITGADPTDPSAGTVNATPSSPDGKAFYKASVHPFLASKCGNCHGTAGPGPNWLTAADADKSYAQILQQGYAVPQSRIVVKGAHGGVTTNVLTSTEIGTFNQWVAMQNGSGATATPNVLAALGGCFDRTKFDAMQMQNWQTTRRTQNNNTNKVTPWNENANNCTGCDNAPCSTCHSSDPATNFVNAVGSPIFGKDYTFTETKKTQPAYISKFFGIGPDGKPIASNGIQKKSDSTMKAKAYTHPMFKLTAQQKTALDAFVDDAIASYAAGKCPATTTPPAK